MSKREEFQKMIEENLAIWGNRLHTLEGKASAAMKVEHEKLIADWKAGAAAAGAKLAELKAEVSDKWDALKVELTKMWHELDASLTGAELAQNQHDDSAKVAPAAEASSAVKPTEPEVALPGPGTKTDNAGAPAARADEPAAVA